MSDRLRRDRRTRGVRILVALDECTLSVEMTTSATVARELSAAVRDLAEAYSILSELGRLDEMPPEEDARTS